MFSSLRRITYILDVIGVVSIIALINLGFKLYRLVESNNTEEILTLYFIYLCMVPVVIFTVSILLRKIIDEIGSDSINFKKRISDLENRTK